MPFSVLSKIASDFWYFKSARCTSKETPRYPIFLEYYHKRVKAGKNKKQALIYIVRRVVNIAYIMLKNKTE